MAKQRAETFEEFLEYGRAPLSRQLMAWMTKEISRPGPWVIRMTTEAEGLGPQEVFREAFDELNPDIVPNIIDALRVAVADRHGPAPMCKIRVQAYMQGESSDPRHVHRNQSVIPSPTTGPSGISFGNNEYAWGVVSMLLANQQQTQAQLVNALGHTTAMNAMLTQQLTAISSVRSVGTTAADMTSGGPFGALIGLAAPAMLAYMWPDIKKILEDRGDGNNTIGSLLKLFNATTNQAVQATETTQALEGALSTGLLGQELADLERVDFSWDEDGTQIDLLDPRTSPRPSPSPQPDGPSTSLDLDVVAELLEQDPAQLAALLDRAGDKTRSWLSSNVMTLASKL